MRILPIPFALLGLLALSPAPGADSAPAPPAGAGRTIVFKDVMPESGITFTHYMAKTPMKFMHETMGPGGGIFDYDLDGDLDVYLVTGRPAPGMEDAARHTAELWRNDGGFRYTNVTEASGAGSAWYGMGICAGDYDNDGYPDLYLANFGPDVLYHNEGDGRFTEAGPVTGVRDDQWGSSCTFLDYDRDGDLDLFVVNYVDFDYTNNKFCGDYANQVRTYCHPNVYNGQPDLLWRNEGDGTFTEVGEAAGISDRKGNGLGVTTGDFDEDGDADIFVANDKTPNTLYRNDGGRFTDITLLSGVGYGLEGGLHAGMGTDWGDYDGDGDLDIVVTNLDFENNSLYRNEGGGIFSDVSFQVGIGGVSMSYVGFGADFVDYDNDGLLDLFIANGHILDNAEYFNDATTYYQRNFMHRNVGGGRFEEVGLSLGPDMAVPNLGRGLASGDIDNDGDLDFLISVCDGRPRLFRNDGGNALPSLNLRLAGTASNRSAVGTTVRVKAGPHRMIDEVRSGGSYQSQGDFRLHFGLGAAKAAEEVEVRWPSGRVDRFTNVAPGFATLIEGETELRR